MSTTITIELHEYQAMRIQLMALQARYQREDLAVQLICLRARLRWPVGGADPARMDIRTLKAELEKLKGIAESSAEHKREFLRRTTDYQSTGENHAAH